MNDTEIQAHNAWERGDIAQAHALFVHAVSEGCNGCMLNLGYFYDEGLSQPRSKSTALHWYVQAYRHGDLSAATNIAIIYRERRQWRTMFSWFRKACAAGDGDAELDLAKCFLTGRGTNFSRSRTLKHLLRATRSHHITPAGQEEARALHRRLTGWSSRRPQALLAGALRASHSGAAYRRR